MTKATEDYSGNLNFIVLAHEKVKVMAFPLKSGKVALVRAKGNYPIENALSLAELVATGEPRP